MKIYVASSWRNESQQSVVAVLREAGHEVYDFKNPSETDKGFAWSDIDSDWQNWTNEQYYAALEHPIAVKGFANDFNAMQWADSCVLVMPCGRSAHVEAGWMQGAGKPTIILQEKEAEPELMYKLFELVTDDIQKVISHLVAIDFGSDGGFPKIVGTSTLQWYPYGEEYDDFIRDNELQQVLGYNPAWKNDFNPKGIRRGYLFGGGFTGTEAKDTEWEYEPNHDEPTHFAFDPEVKI